MNGMAMDGIEEDDNGLNRHLIGMSLLITPFFPTLRLDT